MRTKVTCLLLHLYDLRVHLVGILALPSMVIDEKFICKHKEIASAVGSVCVSVCPGYNFLTVFTRDFIFSVQINLNHIKVKFKLNKKRPVIHLQFFCMPVFTNKLKDQGHLKVPVKVTQYQGQIKENQFSLYCKRFCEDGTPSTEAFLFQYGCDIQNSELLSQPLEC